MPTPALNALLSGSPPLAWATGGLYTPTPAYTSWSGSGATITRNAVLSPDKKLNGLLVVENGANSTHAAVVTNATFTGVAQTETHTVYAKRVSGNRDIQVVQFDSTATFSVSVGISLANGGIVIAAATDGTWANMAVVTTRLANGWWKIAFSYTGIVDTGAWFLYRLVNSAPLASYTGDSISSIAVWGTDFR